MIKQGTISGKIARMSLKRCIGPEKTGEIVRRRVGPDPDKGESKKRSRRPWREIRNRSRLPERERKVFAFLWVK